MDIQTKEKGDLLVMFIFNDFIILLMKSFISIKTKWSVVSSKQIVSCLFGPNKGFDSLTTAG